MGIELRTFESGDQDYIAKLNANVALVQAAINGIQVSLGGVTNTTSNAKFFDALFDGQTMLIGPGSYKPTPSGGTSLSVAAGGVYRSVAQIVVESLAPVLVSFAGQPANTYYIVADDTGAPFRTTTATEGMYSVVWTGSAFGTILQLIPSLFDGTEENAARTSTLLGVFATLGARLNASEAAAAAAALAAQTTADDAYALAYEAAGGESAIRYRKVGLSLDGGGVAITTGVKGSVQVDFNGTIVGWSLIADRVGTLEVEVSLARTSPPSAPAAAPPTPDPVADLISAAAPIAVSAALSASSAAAGVSTWDTGVQQWDVIQFNVVSVTDIQKAVLYIRIQEV